MRSPRPDCGPRGENEDDVFAWVLEFLFMLVGTAAAICGIGVAILLIVVVDTWIRDPIP